MYTGHVKMHYRTLTFYLNIFNFSRLHYAVTEYKKEFFIYCLSIAKILRTRSRTRSFRGMSLAIVMGMSSCHSNDGLFII